MSNTKPTPAAGSEELEVAAALLLCIGYTVTLQNEVLAVIKPEEVIDAMTALITAQNNATYEAVMEAIPANIIKCSDNCRYGEKCRIVLEHNKVCVELRQNIAKIFRKEAK